MIVFNKNRKVKYSILMAEVLVRCSFLFIAPLSPLTDIYHNDVYRGLVLRLPSMAADHYHCYLADTHFRSC